MKKTITILAVALLGLASAGCGENAKNKSEMENPVIENIMARRSIRHYTAQPVPREILQKLAECGVNAPNAMNKQEWEVRIVDDQEYFNGATEIMKAGMPFFANQDDPKFRNAFRNATAGIFIACPDDPTGMALINIGLMGENICLAAESLGLGTVVMAGPVRAMNTIPEMKPYLDKLGFSEGYNLQLIIGIGYPDEAPDAKPRDLGKIKFVE